MLFDEVVETVSESSSSFLSEISPAGAAAIAGGIALVAGICYGGYKLYKNSHLLSEMEKKMKEALKRNTKKEENKEPEPEAQTA